MKIELLKEGPTHEEGHQYTTNPLFQNLLDLRFGPFAHDRQGIGVCYRANCGSTEPWHSEESTEPSHAHQNQKVQMEAWTFHHLSLRFTNN